LDIPNWYQFLASRDLRELSVHSMNRHFPSPSTLANVGHPQLTVFNFCAYGDKSRYLGANLLEFFRNCQTLEKVRLLYRDKDKVIKSSTGREVPVVSLPLLQSFTHESDFGEVPTNLFKRLILPPTCHVAFKLNCERPWDGTWDGSFPTLRDSSFLSNVRTVKITVFYHEVIPKVGVTFWRPRRPTISLIRQGDRYKVSNILSILQESSVKTLRFECCLEEGCIVDPVQTIARGLNRPPGASVVVQKREKLWDRCRTKVKGSGGFTERELRELDGLLYTVETHGQVIA